MKKWMLMMSVVFLGGAALFFCGEGQPEREMALKSKPAWMQQQIREDLASFVGGVGTGLEASDLMRVTLKEGQLIFSPEVFSSEVLDLRARVVKNFLVGLMQQYRLPDVEFCVCLSDTYDKRVGEEAVFVFAKKQGSKFDILMPDFGVLNARMLLKTCKHAVKRHPWDGKQAEVFQSTGYVSPQEQFAYKYVVDSSVFIQDLSRWVLLSNSALIKPMTGYDQWYSKALKPYEHYVPVKGDLSDLGEVERWLKEHGEKGQKIAEDSRKLALRLFSQEAIEEYMATLIGEYAKLYSNNLKNREFGKEFPQIFCSARETVFIDTNRERNEKSEAKSTPPKTDSSSCLSI